MPLKVVTPPPVEPVALDEVKRFLRIDFADLDPVLSGLVTAARQLCEAELARSFVTTAWLQTFDRWPTLTVNLATGQVAMGWSQLNWSPERVYPATSEPVRLFRADLLAVSAVQYVGPDGTLTTMDPAGYQVQYGPPPKVLPACGATWPAARVEPDAVRITFTAGYGPDGRTTPECVKTAIQLLTGLLLENPLGFAAVPDGIKAVLRPEEWGLYV